MEAVYGNSFNLEAAAQIEKRIVRSFLSDWRKRQAST
jgi:hypothetical protein